MIILFAGIITLISVLAVGVIALWIAARNAPTEPTSTVMAQIYKVRSRYFFIITTVLTVTLIATLAFVPYPQAQGEEPAVTMSVIGAMWSWNMTPEGPNKATVTKDAEGAWILPLNKHIAFDVTANDVNHGFGIYNPDGRLLGQTQAMPGYVNRLFYTFKRPGRYTVLCMEYCGVGHQLMITHFLVK